MTMPNANAALTPATVMLAELVRRYWVLGMECSLLEIIETGVVSGTGR